MVGTMGQDVRIEPGHIGPMCKRNWRMSCGALAHGSIINEASATGGWCPWLAQGDSNVTVWLLIYGAGIVPALAAISLFAFVRRESHQMPPRAVAKLAMSAGLVWPLLAIAGVQVVGLLVLKAALGLVRGRGDDAVATVEATAVPMLQPLAAAAA
jgi:hypothetical protein